jgi:hypothetical protein
MYDWLQYNGKGGEDETEYHKSLEYPACEFLMLINLLKKI